MASIKNMITPDFGGATDVTVIEILVKPGDTIQKDTPVLTLESDKATMELPASDGGVVKDIKVKVGDQISTGSLLMTIETSGDGETKETKQTHAPTKPAAKETRTTKKAEKVKPVETEDANETEEAPLTGVLQSTSDIHAGPGVRRLARELGVNLLQVLGTGPKERILKEDVQTYVKNKLTQLSSASASQTLPALPTIDFTKFGEVELEGLSRIKKISGKNLQRNWIMIPHVTQFSEADITALEAFRLEQKATMEKQKIKLTPLVFIMKAVVASLKTYPRFNASLDASGEHLVLKKYFHLGVAVDTPDGLVVPVIRDVDKKGLKELAKELGDISEKARKKQLTPADMQGGCFSISSLGGIGGTAFTPIINYPEVAILGVSKSFYKPVYQSESEQFVPRLMLPLSLSYDHRVIDGAEGARFIMHLSQMLSDIRNLLM